MNPITNERLHATAQGMPMHAVYRWLSRRIGASAATTYFVLRRHGMTAGEAWERKGQGVGARYAWHSLPVERLSLADRVFLLSRTSAIDACARLGRRKRRNQQSPP